MDFEHYWDKSHVLEGCPWIFEGQLFAVEEFDGYTSPSKLNFDITAFWIRMYDLPLMCMGREMGFKLGSTVGKVEEVKTNDDGVRWGEYLCVRVRVILHRLLPSYPCPTVLM